MERPEVYFVSFKRLHKVDVEPGFYKSNNFNFELDYATDIRITAKVHWMPAWTVDTALAIALERCSQGIKVASVERETVKIKGMDIESGVRTVKMVVNQREERFLPYIIQVDGKPCMLIVPGRPPLCLRCREVGHIRAECPRNVRPARGYASVVSGGQRTPGSQPGSRVANPSDSAESGGSQSKGNQRTPESQPGPRVANPSGSAESEGSHVDVTPESQPGLGAANPSDSAESVGSHVDVTSKSQPGLGAANPSGSAESEGSHTDQVPSDDDETVENLLGLHDDMTVDPTSMKRRHGEEDDEAPWTEVGGKRLQGLSLTPAQRPK